MAVYIYIYMLWGGKSFHMQEKRKIWGEIHAFLVWPIWKHGEVQGLEGEIQKFKEACNCPPSIR